MHALVSTYNSPSELRIVRGLLTCAVTALLSIIDFRRCRRRRRRRRKIQNWVPKHRPNASPSFHRRYCSSREAQTNSIGENLPELRFR